MPFITQGKANIKYLLIVGLVAAFSGGIIFYAWNCYQKESSNIDQILQIKQANKSRVSANVVWSRVLDGDILSSLHKCGYQSSDCAAGVMLSNGASPEAIKFFKEEKWFVTKFTNYGKVSLLEVFDPWRANSNDDYVLVNGKQRPITVEGAVGSVEGEVFKTFPKYTLQNFNNSFFKRVENSFIFYVQLVNGCKLCSTGYDAMVSFDFDQDGIYQGERLVGFCTEEGTKDSKYSRCIFDQTESDVETDTKISMKIFKNQIIDLNVTTTKLAILPGEYISRIPEDTKWIPPEIFTTQMKISPDGRQAAYIIVKKGKTLVAVNGKEGVEYNNIYGLTFSPNSKQVTYIATQGDRQFIVVDGKEGKQYKYIVQFAFSPDSQKLAYVGCEEDKCSLVINGVEEKTYNWISDLTFSSDSQKLVYVAEKEKRRDGFSDQFAVINSEEGKSYYIIRCFTLSPDGQRLAYAAQEEKEAPQQGYDNFVVVNNQEGKSYDHVYHVTFSPDSQKLAYSAGNGFGELMVVNEKESKNMGYSAIGYITFSPDSQHLSYIANKKGKHVVVIDDKEGKVYDSQVDWLVFSPDSQRLAYVVGVSTVVVDNQEGKPYKFTSMPIFSPNSQHLAYIAHENNKEFIVFDDKEGNKYDRIFWSTVFSSDGKYITYGALSGNELWWIVDKAE